MFQYPQNPANTPAPYSALSSLLVLICSGIALFGPLLSEIRPGLSEAVRSSPYRSAFDLHVSHLLLAEALSKLPPTKSFASALPWCYMYTPHMAKSSPHFFRQTLEKLAEEPPTTKTALLHSLLPQIQVALRSGKTLKQVWQRLAEDGLDISCETFCRLIRRERAKPRATATPNGNHTGEPVSLSE